MEKPPFDVVVATVEELQNRFYLALEKKLEGVIGGPVSHEMLKKVCAEIIVEHIRPLHTLTDDLSVEKDPNDPSRLIMTFSRPVFIGINETGKENGNDLGRNDRCPGGLDLR
jgi:hypothetical protein